MNFAAILAAGNSIRMGNPDKPKQFFLLGEKPVLIHTVEKFCLSGLFEKVFLLCPKAWIQQTKDLVETHCPQYATTIEVLAGGELRNETIQICIDHIEGNYSTNKETILVTHDAVRPFVSLRIIEENVKAAAEHGACDTVIPATDTIAESTDAAFVTAIPDRKHLYQGQTPQSFKMKKLKELYHSLSLEEKLLLTDACKIFVLRNEKVALVNGDGSNIKITHPQDMRVAQAFLGEPLC